MLKDVRGGVCDTGSRGRTGACNSEESSLYCKQPLCIYLSSGFLMSLRTAAYFLLHLRKGFFYAIQFNKYLIILKVFVISCRRSNLPTKLFLDCKTYNKKMYLGYTSDLCLNNYTLLLSFYSGMRECINL
jgi:hypothetical protein